MTKILSFLILLAMVVHIIRPLGLPGLRRRKDFWKLALAAIIIFGIVVLLRPGG